MFAKAVKAKILVLFSVLLVLVNGPNVSQQVRANTSTTFTGYTKLYDFETGAQGWGMPYGAIKGVASTNEQAKDGQYSLKLAVNFEINSSGEASVNLPSVLDMQGQTISAWAFVPIGARGDPQQPNGIHLFAVDSNGKKLYGTWQYFLEGGWFQITLPVKNTQPACGSIDSGFQPGSISRIGINIAIPAESVATFSGSIFLDKIEYGVPALPQSTHFYNFENATSSSRYPSWELVPGWNAAGLDSPTIQNGSLTMQAHFTTVSDTTRKGSVGIVYSPPLDLANKNNAVISADIRFTPSGITPGANCPFVVSIWAYDDEKRKWFISDDLNVGTSEWTRISFDLRDMVQYKPGVKDYENDTPSLDSIRQVAFQFWANTNYYGQLLIDNVAIGGEEINHPNTNSGIVQARDGEFVLNNQNFQFVGANAEYLFTENSSTVEGIFDQAAALGITVIRTWGFSEGCEDPSMANCAIWSRRFQPERGQWNETVFQNFDQIVALASAKGIRLIIPLANNWGEYGGRPQYVNWLAQEYPQEIPPDTIPGTDAYWDLFYTNPHTKQWYKDFVTHFLNRTNTLTGIRYRDDPTIFAWELINEPRAASDITGATVHQWLLEMSDYIEGIDSQHMIGTGEEGWYIMVKSQADASSILPDSTVWQSFPNNYWEYGVNWKPEGEPAWSSNGVDFFSDHNSAAQEVCWQDYAGAVDQAAVECEIRQGLPNIDFASMHLYIDLGASNIYLAPYCDAGFNSVLCDSLYNRPYHQAFLWVEKHLSDATALGKPLIIGEFGFRTSGRGGPSSGGMPRHTPPFDSSHRAQMFDWYLNKFIQVGVDGALFWNLGYNGFPESLWDGADSVANSATSLWQVNSSSDTTNLALCPGPVYVTQGRYSICASFDPAKGYNKAFVDRINIVGTDKDWSPEFRRRFRFDIYVDQPVGVIIGLITGNDQAWYEAIPQSVNRGWNTLTVDVDENIWKTAASGWQYNSMVNNVNDVRQVSIGISGFTMSGVYYIDNLRHVGNDGLVLYSDDPAMATIKQFMCQNFIDCLYLPLLTK